MARSKTNPLLASYEARLETRYQARLSINSEIDLIAHLISCNEDLKVGPGRAEKALNGFLETKLQVAEEILADSKSDKELLHTKRDIAARLKQILGPENWLKYQEMFPLLQEYWEDRHADETL